MHRVVLIDEANIPITSCHIIVALLEFPRVPPYLVVPKAVTLTKVEAADDALSTLNKSAGASGLCTALVYRMAPESAGSLARDPVFVVRRRLRE